MRVVVKLGSSVLTGGTHQLNRPMMVELARQCAHLRQAGHDVIICSSGAVAAGLAVLDYPDLPQTITTKQLLAAVGQGQLMQVWSNLFDIYSEHVAQMLLTRADVTSRARYVNAQNTLHALLAQGIIPIVNENDAIVVDEIKLGDNDNLSALVAILAEADLLLLMTDQNGLYTADPRKDASAKLISQVTEITPHIWSIAGDSGTYIGTGGMMTKIQSAETATRAGINVVIARGYTPNIIIDLVSGIAHGTKFIAQSTTVENKQKWLLAGAKSAGLLTIDHGAVQALLTMGGSLLPAGVIAITGNFQRGDTVDIIDEKENILARGITRYDTMSLSHIMGCQSSEINPKLGYTYGNNVVHRNDMIILNLER